MSMKQKPKIILGIETSCDETAAALVTSEKQVLAHRVLSQIDDHAAYGGVVPEIAARQHISHLDHLLAALFEDAGLSVQDIDGVAATTGPGLVGGLMVGVMTAKAIAKAAQRPFLAINHLEGHALTARLVEDIAFPFLLLLVSGGHCQILAVKGVGDYERLGTTIDDAAGEAFDKTAKLLNLGYPGGPIIETLAKEGDPHRFALPRPLKGHAGCDFSFSGLKTAVRRAVEAIVAENGVLSRQDQCDLSACFQAAVAACLEDRLSHAFEMFRAAAPAEIKAGKLPFVVAGGVAANKALRSSLETLAADHNFSFHAPPIGLCTDNGAMIAWAGVEKILIDPDVNDIDLAPRPRWPLDSEAAPRVGGGRKGAKA